MARTKGKVNEQSLEVLKKSVKAGGRKSSAKAEKKPATPVRSASRARSRSRSRTPGRAQKVAEVQKAETKTPAKKTPAAKRKSEAPKLKRLDAEKKKGGTKKKAAGTGKGRGRPPKVTEPASASAPAGRKRGTRRPSKAAEAHISKEEAMDTNNVQTSTSVPSINSRGRKSKSPVSSEEMNGSTGWFSKCIIS